MVLCSSSFQSPLGVAFLREQEGWGGAGQPHTLAGHGAPWLCPLLSQHVYCCTDNTNMVQMLSWFLSFT